MGVLEPAALSVSNSDLAEFESFRKFLQKECGIFLSDNKRYLVDTRIRQIMSRGEFQNLAQLINQAQRDSNLRLQVVDAMTTNETYWFRDTYPFQWFEKYLRSGEESRPKIWSAACSSGQEPYSLSMIAKEVGVQASIVGTDISPTMLDTAREGVYDNLAMARGLSPERQASHFTTVGDKHWRFDDEQRRKIDFRSLNLMASYGGMGSFDVIFCRNVLIYFEMDLKRDILERLHKCLKPGGYLFLGASEGLAGADELFTMINCKPGICYQAV